MNSATSNSRGGLGASLSVEDWVALQSNYPFKLILLNTQGNLLYQNIQMEGSGIDSSEDLLAVVLHKNCQEEECRYRKLLSKEISDYSEEITLKNDNILKITARTVAGNLDAAFSLIIEDITETKKMETVLKKNERRLRAFLDASPDIFLTVNPQGIIKSSHSRKQEIQILQGNLIGKKIDEVILLDRLEELKQAIRFAHERGSDLQIVKGQWLQENFTKSVEIRVVPGGTMNVVLLVRDNSELFQKEESIKVLERNSSFVEIASGMNQEMMTNLQSISNYARFLLKEESTGISSTYIKKIEELSDITGKILQNVFSYSHYSEEKSMQVDLMKIISEAVDYCRFGLNKSIELFWEGKGEAWVQVPYKQMAGMIINLVMNAREAIQDRGSIVINCTEKVLQLGDRTSIQGSWSEGVFYQINIMDTGIGISPEVLEKIFNPLFSTKNGGGSTGMGLTILKRFIHEIHGGMEVQSTPGKGTVFSLYIPSITQKPLKGVKNKHKQTDKENAGIEMEGYQLVVPETAIDLLEGNMDLYRTICHDFILDYGDSLDSIDLEIQGEDWSKARILVHSIKGLAGLIGSKVLQESARDFEKVLKDRDETQIVLESGRFKAILLQVLSELKVYLAGLEMAEKESKGNIDFDRLPPLTAEQVQDLKGLDQSLVYSEYNLATDKISEMIQVYGEGGLSDVLLTIQDWVNQFHFDKSYTYIQKLIKKYEDNKS